MFSYLRRELSDSDFSLSHARVMLINSSFTETIGHFRITLGLFFKASLGAHLFICKINFHSHENEFNLRVNEN